MVEGPRTEADTAYAPDCLFCQIFRTKDSERKWHDQILYIRDGIAVLPALGAQCEGYLLIVPKAHAFSCAELSQRELVSLERVKDRVRRVLEQAYGPCVFFEHGACATERRAGGCIDHVHVHALPTRAPIVEFANRERSFPPLNSNKGLKNWRRKPYVAIQDQAGGTFIADGEGLPGQFMRQVIDKTLDSPGEWDYTVYPHEGRVRATIDKITHAFDDHEDEDPRYAQQWDRTGPKARLIYVGRAVDELEKGEVREGSDELQLKVKQAGFAPVEPFVSMFPRAQSPTDANKETSDFNRVANDLEWLRRSDAALIDMSIDKWSYVGCVCELVYAHRWGIPVIVYTGQSRIKERVWLQYHATVVVEDLDEAIEELKKLFDSPPPRPGSLAPK